MRTFTHHSNEGKKNIYVMYVYDCNAIPNTSTKNISNKETIRAFTKLTEDLKSQGINPCYNITDNKASTTLKLTMKTMNIKYQLVPPSNHRGKNAEIEIQTFKNHFMAGLCSLEKYFHLQLLDRLLQQATISLRLLMQSITLLHISAYTHIFG